MMGFIKKLKINPEIRCVYRIEAQKSEQRR